MISGDFLKNTVRGFSRNEVCETDSMDTKSSESCSCLACTKSAGHKPSFGKSVMDYDDESSPRCIDDSVKKRKIDNSPFGKLMRKGKTGESAKRAKCPKKSKVGISDDSDDVSGLAMQSMREQEMCEFGIYSRPDKICGCCGLFSRIFGPFIVALLLLQYTMGFFGRWVLADDCFLKGNLCEMERYDCRGPYLAWYWCDESITGALKAYRNYPFDF
ncbi:unnamed protein product [Allacma fusca]|uniref:Uncharacterized protein n=1 Tax=Allacma fusca TaxID=39272 RepID=A0A8J2LFF4_9HEXA|nr:unnamed protein product [Allacma fusca]